MPKANRVCKYSQCDNKYYACNDSIRLGGWKSFCCSKEHFEKWQTEVSYFRGQDISDSHFLKEMVEEGSLPSSVLPKPKTRIKKIEPEIDLEIQTETEPEVE